MSQVDAQGTQEKQHLKPYLQWRQAEEYLADLKKRCSSSETIAVYRRNLKHFFQFLPDDGNIDHDTVVRWRDYLLANGYKPNTVNVRLSAVNGFLGYLDCREYQHLEHLKNQDDVQPTLTRDEYFQLLLAARVARDERVYLMIKVFATTGISVSHMKLLTVQSVYDQAIQVDETHVLKIPSVVAAELESFVKQEGIQSGPLFVDEDGKALGRWMITSCIQEHAKEAGLESEKCTPRCLRKLYQMTQEEIQQEVKCFADQIHERLLKEEQSLIDWYERRAKEMRWSG